MTRIRVPATSANLGPGFDTLGMALQFYNHFEATLAETLTVRLSPNTCVEVDGLSLDPQENLLAQAYQAYFKFRGDTLIPVELVIEAHVPLSRGLGSSSSAIVAGLFLADSLHPEPLGRDALVPWAVELEGHPDNVVPAMLGGVRCCLADGTNIAMTWPEAWGIGLVIPPTPQSTHAAREIMPPHYTQQEAVQTVRGIAVWIYALFHRDPSLFRKALASDALHEPARGQLIPEFSRLKSLLADTDALGCVISGSGSTLAVYTPSPEVHQDIMAKLKAPESGLSHCRIITAQPDNDGVTVMYRDVATSKQ
jgi:homoserine kinase